MVPLFFTVFSLRFTHFSHKREVLRGFMTDRLEAAPYHHHNGMKFFWFIGILYTRAELEIEPDYYLSEYDES